MHALVYMCIPKTADRGIFFRHTCRACVGSNRHLFFIQVGKGLITGILKVAKAGLFSDLNNPKIYTTLSHKYADSFGFTSQETDGLLDRADLPKKAQTS